MDKVQPTVKFLSILGAVTIIFCTLIFKASNDPVKKEQVFISDIQYKLISIDDCQYILAPAHDNSYTLCHKGNCTNNFHKAFKE